MTPDWKNTIVKRVYNTDDIRRCVCDTFNKSWRQVEEIAPQLDMGDEVETCRAIWQFAIDNVRYVADPDQHQWVQTPARLLANGEGDCKSISILCASLLTALHIPCQFRFVSFGTEDVRHVYVVATNTQTAVDPVEYMQNGREFGEVTPYNYSIDMDINIGQGLAVLSGINATTKVYDVWTDGFFMNNTRGANYIYSQIDLNLALIRANGNDTAALNDCDLWVTALHLYNEATVQNGSLKRAGAVLQCMADQGMFDDQSTDDNSRSMHLENCIQAALGYYNSESLFEESGDLYELFKEEVADQDVNLATQAEVETYEQFFGSKVGASTSNELLSKIQESAPYFVYIYISDEWIEQNKRKYPEIQYKRLVQQNTFDIWADGLNTNMTKASLKNTLRSGFIKRYECTPEEFVAAGMESKGGTAKVKGAKVGFVITAAVVEFVVAIGTIIAGLATIIKSIFDFVLAIRKQRANEIMASKSKYAEGNADASDFWTGTSSTSSSSAAAKTETGGNFLFIALAALLIFKMKK